MDQINCIAIGIMLLLAMMAGKKEKVLSCGPVKNGNAPASWPKKDNNGQGCMHQSVCAAFFGRSKRDKPHSC